MALSDLDRALLELARARGALTDTGVERVRKAATNPDGPNVESALGRLVDGPTFQALCDELPEFYARRCATSGDDTLGSDTEHASFRARRYAEPPPIDKIGRYRIDGVLGRGALGLVYLVKDEQTNRPFALKILTEAGDDVATHRFRREVRALTRVAHENVVLVFDYGEHDGRPFYVMELLEGETIADLVERITRVEPRLMARIARDVATGLGAIHAFDIIHRDVKPANILIEKTTGRGVIIDFSIARLPDATMTLTREGFSVGTPTFMAPEQICGDPIVAATDLYGLGVTMFFAIEGHSPYFGLDKYDDLAEAKLDKPPPRISRADVPEWLVDLVARLMATSPSDRFASAGAAVAEIDRLLASS